MSFRISKIALLTVLPAFSCHAALSAPVPGASLNVTATETKASRPQMPPIFDLNTVERLITDIDHPPNAAILKVGYFMRRGSPELPVMEGFKLLKVTLDKEPVGSKRWFLLNNLLASAAFRVSGQDPSQGFVAYNLLFTHSQDAVRVDARYVLRQAILEYVAMVPGRLKDLGLVGDERTKETLFKAWSAYIATLSSANGTDRLTEPPWDAAIEASGGTEDFMPYAERAIADKSIPKNFSVLFTVALIIAPKNPERSLLFLDQAKPLLSSTNGKLNINQAVKFYGVYTQILIGLNRRAEAIELQRELITLTGRGQADLLILLHEQNDQEGFQLLMNRLLLPTANEYEINKAAKNLFELEREGKNGADKAGNQAVALLTNYLLVPREREIGEELSARLALASFYQKHHDVDKAKSILAQAPLPETSQPRVRRLLQEVERMRAQLQDTIINY